MKNWKIWGIVPVLAIAGCSHTPPPQPEIRVQTVYCVTEAQYLKLIAAMPPKVGSTLTGQAQQDLKIEGSSNVLLREYANGLLDVIGGCTKPVIPQQEHP